MGQDWRPDEAISPKLMKALTNLLSRRVSRSRTPKEAAKWVTARAYFVCLYVFSLRGPEGLLIEMEGVLSTIQDGLRGSIPYVSLALLGKVKGENHTRHHMMHSVATTSSGLQVRKTIEALMLVRRWEGRSRGPAICDEAGVVWTTQFANQVLHEALETLFAIEPKLFPKRFTNSQELKEWYHVFRTFRRGSDSRALAQGVAETDVNTVNRWAQKEKAKGKKMAHKKMYGYYAQTDIMMECFLRYTNAM